MTRLRAAWVTHAAPGCAVAPRIRTRRVACSITAEMYRRAPRHARRPLAIALRLSVDPVINDAARDGPRQARLETGFTSLVAVRCRRLGQAARTVVSRPPAGVER